MKKNFAIFNDKGVYLGTFFSLEGAEDYVKGCLIKDSKQKLYIFTAYSEHTATLDIVSTKL